MISRVELPQLLNIHSLHELARRAVAACGLGEDAVAHLQGMCGHWDKLVLVAIEQERPVGLLCVELPNPFMLHPQITLAYNEGSMETGNELFASARAYVAAHGFTQVGMTNRSRAPDDVWARGVEIRLRAKEVHRTSRITVEFNHDAGRRGEQ